jgi:hypothetical protein
MGANILGYAQIFQDVRTYLIGSEYFDMRRYFEDVRIHFWKRTFLCVKCYFRQAPIFNDFAVSSVQLFSQ